MKEFMEKLTRREKEVIHAVIVIAVCVAILACLVMVVVSVYYN